MISIEELRLFFSDVKYYFPLIDILGTDLSEKLVIFADLLDKFLRQKSILEEIEKLKEFDEFINEVCESFENVHFHCKKGDIAIGAIVGCCMLNRAKLNYNKISTIELVSVQDSLRQLEDILCKNIHPAIEN